MRYKKLLSSIISVTAVCAVLASALSFSASAAEIDEEELISAPQAVLDSVSEGNTESSSLPSTYSSVDLGYVSSVKEQLYNDCWVYGALGTLESTLLKNDLYIGDMSVNHANIWGSTRSSGKGWVRRTGEAGRAKIMLGYLTSWQGAVLDSKLPGLEVTDFTPDELPTDLADFGVTSIKYLYREDADSIKQAIMESGGISTYYSNSVNCFNYDTYSFYMSPDYADSYMGHAIEIVGWDDNYPAENFKETPSENGAWLVKNSWGDDWGINGFFWISYEDRDLFHPTKYFPSYQIKSIEKITEDTKLLQNEIYGATYEFNYIKGDELTAFESFDFDSDYNVLDKVVFETTSQGADYKIYYVPDKDGVPDSDESNWTELYSSTVEYAGYICADFDDFEIPDSSGNVAIRISALPGAESASLGVCEWLTSGGKFTFKYQTEKDLSYVMDNGKIYDTKDWYSEIGDDNMGGTFSIKAITKKSAPKPGDVDLNGIVDINDATLLQKHIALIVKLDDKELSVSDMNGDGYITISDVTLIQQMIAEI